MAVPARAGAWRALSPPGAALLSARRPPHLFILAASRVICTTAHSRQSGHFPLLRSQQGTYTEGQGGAPTILMMAANMALARAAGKAGTLDRTWQTRHATTALSLPPPDATTRPTSPLCRETCAPRAHGIAALGAVVVNFDRCAVGGEIAHPDSCLYNARRTHGKPRGSPTFVYVQRRIRAMRRSRA